MFEFSKRPNIDAFVLNIGEFDIQICFEFRISIFGFSLNRAFRSGTN